MTFRPLTNSDLLTEQTFHQFHELYSELDLHRIMSGFIDVFATRVACQQGTLTLPDTWFRPPFWDLLVLKFLRPDSSNSPCLYSTFHIEYPLFFLDFALRGDQYCAAFLYFLNIRGTFTDLCCNSCLILKTYESPTCINLRSCILLTPEGVLEVC